MRKHKSEIPENQEELREELYRKLRDEHQPDYAAMLYGFDKVGYSIDGPLGYTDFRSIYISPKLSLDEKSLVARHEMLHVLLNHDKQAMTDERYLKYHAIFNVACDFELSNYYDMKDVRTIKKSKLLKGACVIDDCPEFWGKTAEQIFEILIQKANEYKEKFKQMIKDMEGKKGDGQNDQSNGQSDQSDGQDESQDNQSDSGQADGQSDDQENKEVSSKDTADSYAAATALNEILKEKIKDMVDVAARKEEAVDKDLKRDMGKASGTSLPKHDLDEPDVNEGRKIGGTEHQNKAVVKEVPPDHVIFRRRLKATFGKQRMVTRTNSFQHPNKKYQDSDIIVKGRGRTYNDMATLAVYVDVSGSMDESKIARARGTCEEVKKLKKVDCKVFYFDTEVQETFFNGGGTSYYAVLEHAKTNGFKSICIITDDTKEDFDQTYLFDYVWIIGVEDGNKKHYSFSDRINATDKRGKVVAKKESGVYIILPNGTEKTDD